MVTPFRGHGQAPRPRRGVPVIRVPVLLLLAFSLLTPGRPAVAVAAPALCCTDFLARMHRMPPHLAFVGCRPLPDQQGRPVRATYRVDGRHAAGVEVTTPPASRRRTLT